MDEPPRLLRPGGISLEAIRALLPNIQYAPQFAAEKDTVPAPGSLLKHYSPRARLLYDIYHMQVMEGDIIQTIRDNHQWIAYYHTAGVPGRHEIDASQELNYAAISRAIAETGFGGYLGQEFLPTADWRSALREAFEICSV